ncbi:ABC transporter ATP-binding protein [Amycolatopsis sp. NPDC005232]|uniref:ABC transporter ATP-binding protein n=1 Tax=unclassified Amycolatopsis TaxID=2618356 RepID=UPI001C695E91|nr:ABC transporter ATP-binding protein [Amycolatopsis sp. DSM 110486]QYN18095.1 ABC transporter ATP-binding protein [Amycolatopsis sp. DSM 110486]
MTLSQTTDTLPARIVVDDLTVTMQLKDRSFDAVQNASFTIEPGQTLAIVGPSGCGKTTLLNVLGGFTGATTGEALIDGAPVGAPDEHRATVFQADAVFPWLTVRGNLEYGPRIRHAQDAASKARTEHFLQVLGLEAFADEFPKVLSGGMRKRVDIGRAYVNNPRTILLDEPFGALDEITKEQLQDELVNLSVSDPKTLVFITHDIEEAIFVGDMVAVMTPRPGRIRKIIDVPFARPRPENVRMEPAFQELRREIQSLLRNE